MESRGTSLLENILERLTKIETQQETQLKKQSHIDQVIERLDTIQNCLERQNHKQNLLHDKLSAVSVSTQMMEEKVFSKDRLLTDLSTQLEQEKLFLRDQFSAIFTQLAHETPAKKSPGQDLPELQQQNVSARPQAVSACEMSMEKFLDQLATVTEEVKKNTNPACQKLKEELMTSYKDTIYNTQKKIESTIKQSTQKVVGHLASIKKDVMKQTDSACKELKEMLKSKTVGDPESAVKETVKNVIDHVSKVKDELITTYTHSCEQLKNEMHQSHKDTLKNSQEEIETAVQEATEELKEDISEVHRDLDKTKRDLVAFIEGQSQIVRDRIAGPLPKHKIYVCDFYIENFRQLVRSGEQVTSLPWHINQFDSSVCGQANFPKRGKMKVWLIFGRHPRQLGLQPSLCSMLRYKAIIKDTSGQLPDLVVGEQTSTWQETNVTSNADWGYELGEMSCNELIQWGFGDREGYKYKALLVRYEIEIIY